MADTAVDQATGTVFTKAADAPTTTAAFASTVPPAPALAADPAVAPAPAVTPAADPSAVPTAPESLLNTPPEPAVDPAAKVDEPVVPLDPASYKIEGLPEGITAEDPLVKSFLEGAAKGGMDNESVNAVLSEIAPKIAEQLRAPYQAWKTLNDTWQAEIKADPDIGGAKLPQTIATINKGIERFGDAAAVRDALNATGAGNNPAIVRMLSNVFSKLVEGTPVVGSPAEQKIVKNPGAVLYDNPSSKQAASA